MVCLFSGNASAQDDAVQPEAVQPDEGVGAADTTAGDEGGAADEGSATDKKGPVVVNNKICPVSGHEIGSMGEGATREYNGKIYHFCCAMCFNDFDLDPEK